MMDADGDDNDYEPPKKGKSGKKSSSSAPKKGTKGAAAKKKFYVDDTFLNKHKDEIVQRHQAGDKPSQIAQYLRLHHLQGLREDSVTAKQVDNWLQYRKRSGQLKTRPVTITNSNLNANSTDCMNCLVSVFYFLIIRVRRWRNYCKRGWGSPQHLY